MKDTQKFFSVIVGFLAVGLSAIVRADGVPVGDATPTNAVRSLVSIRDDQPGDGAMVNYSFSVGAPGNLSTPFLNTCLMPSGRLDMPAKSAGISSAWANPVEFSGAVIEKAKPDFGGSSIGDGESDGGFHPNSFTPVPEPPTIVSGILVVLPFGACALRILRRRRVF